MRLLNVILTLALTPLLLTASARAADEPKSPVVTKVRQLQVKMRLLRGGTLSDALAHNQQEWNKLSPERREKFRREAYAFLQKSPAQQEQLLRYYAQFMDLSEERKAAYEERAKWLSAVVGSLTPQQKEELEALSSPQERARRLLDLKNEMIRQGKLPADTPATAPASP